MIERSEEIDVHMRLVLVNMGDVGVGTAAFLAGDDGSLVWQQASVKKPWRGGAKAF